MSSIPLRRVRTSSNNEPRENEDAMSFLGDENSSSDQKTEEAKTNASHAKRKPLSILSLATEIACLGLAILSFLGFVAILRVYDGKPNLKWLLGRLGSPTPNAITPIMSTVFRATLLAPVASCISQFCWV